MTFVAVWGLFAFGLLRLLAGDFGGVAGLAGVWVVEFDLGCLWVGVI